jgi:hypothetical protein
MQNIIIDLETAPLPLADLEAAGLVPAFEADRRLKDEAKIAQDLADKKAAWYDKAALSAVTGKVIMIGILDHNHAKVGMLAEAKPVKSACDRLFFSNEAELLQWGMRELGAKGQHSSMQRIIGHNVKAFDLPFMRRRCWATGASWIGPVMSGRYWADNVVDTMELWACGDYQARISLDNLGKLLGVGNKSDDYADFLPYRDWPNSMQKSVDYLINDLQLTRDCYQRMTK